MLPDSSSWYSIVSGCSVFIDREVNLIFYNKSKRIFQLDDCELEFLVSVVVIPGCKKRGVGVP